MDVDASNGQSSVVELEGGKTVETKFTDRVDIFNIGHSRPGTTLGTLVLPNPDLTCSCETPRTRMCLLGWDSNLGPSTVARLRQDISWYLLSWTVGTKLHGFPLENFNRGCLFSPKRIVKVPRGTRHKAFLETVLKKMSLERRQSCVEFLYFLANRSKFTLVNRTEFNHIAIIVYSARASQPGNPRLAMSTDTIFIVFQQSDTGIFNEKYEKYEDLGISYQFSMEGMKSDIKK